MINKIDNEIKRSEYFTIDSLCSCWVPLEACCGCVMLTIVDPGPAHLLMTLDPEEVGHGWTLLIKEAGSSLIDFLYLNN